jgi:UDP:flavonoid glycosyltransferase YjiC (YdhE family)
MRVLFVSTPDVGHVFPLVPLAWALRAAGHEVLLATCGEGMIAANAGIQVVDIAPGFSMRTMMEQRTADDPELLERLRETARQRDVSFAVVLFSPMNRHLVDGVMRLAEDWRPDLVVHDQMGAIGVLAAARLGVPAVQQNFGFVRTGAIREGLGRALVDLYEQYGVSGSAERTVTLDVAPPSMVAEPDGWSVRYVSYNGGGVLPQWLVNKPARPRVAITLGTVVPLTDGLGPVQQIIEAAPQIDAEFVLALGDADTCGLGGLPPNVWSVGWVPLNAFLTTCTAIVHHGGSGTTMTALEAGVPQLLLPDGADRFFNGDAVRDRGNGLSARPGELDAALLKQLLSDEQLRGAASEVRTELATLPTPTEVVRRLVKL